MNPSSSSYYAVIFSSIKKPDAQGYNEMAQKMEDLAHLQQGYLGIESTRGSDGFGITVSYWESVEAIQAWKKNSEHLLAQKHGRSEWYRSFKVRICKVEREYGFDGSNS